LKVYNSTYDIKPVRMNNMHFKPIAMQIPELALQAAQPAYETHKE